MSSLYNNNMINGIKTSGVTIEQLEEKIKNTTNKEELEFLEFSLEILKNKQLL